MTANQVRDAQQTPLYDTYSLDKNTATPTEIEFFARQAGGSVGRQLTNLPKANSVGSGDLFHVLGVRLVCLGMTLKDIIALCKNYTFQFFKNDVKLLEAPPEFWPGGAGVVGAASTTATTTTIQFFGNGVPDPRAITSIAPQLEIKLDGGDRFGGKLVGTTFTSENVDDPGGIFIRCYLDGVWEKPANPQA